MRRRDLLAASPPTAISLSAAETKRLNGARGELDDLSSDPLEQRDLFDSAGHRRQRNSDPLSKELASYAH